jgi:hypothetical protein
MFQLNITESVMKDGILETFSFKDTRDMILGKILELFLVDKLEF